MCIPLKSFDHVYEFLTKDDFGHFNIAPHSHCFPRCDPLLKYFDRSLIQKSSEWFILNRTLCDLAIHYDYDALQEQYTPIGAPEEHFFISLVFQNHLEEQVRLTPNIADGATTFKNWSDMPYKFHDSSVNGLKNYSSISPDELLYLLESKSLFGRKFNIECSGSLHNPTYLDKISPALWEKKCCRHPRKITHNIITVKYDPVYA